MREKRAPEGSGSSLYKGGDALAASLCFLRNDVLLDLALCSGELDDSLVRADLNAHSAVLACVEIDNSVIVDNVDGVELAGLFAFAAGYAAGCALLACLCSLVCGAAGYVYEAVLRNQLYDAVRACPCAGSAACAVVPVYPGNAVYDADSVELAGSYAVAEAYAAVHAGTVAAVDRLVGLTCRNTLVFEDLICLAVIAAALYKRYFRLGSGYLDAHDLAELSRAGRTAYSAGCEVSAVIYDSARVVGTSREAAAAAVCSRKSFCKLFYSLVDRYIHYLSGDRKHYAGDDADDRYENDWE